MGASNDLTALLVVVWLFGLIFVLASLIRPVPPFRSRMQALFLGLPGILVGPFVLAIALGWAPKPRHPDSVPAIATAQEPQSASRAPEETGPSPSAPNGAVATTTTTNPGGPSAPEIVGLTHINKALGKRVTYSQARTRVLVSQDVPAGAWSIKEVSTKVICFVDGNNAVFFTIGERFIAANGKARQFVRHKAGEGIVLANDKVAPVEELERGTHTKLVDAVIDAGLALCGQKSVDEISNSVEEAAEAPPAAAQPVASRDNEVLLNAALAIRGADICGYDFNAASMVDYLQEHDVDQEAFTTKVEPYLVIANGILSSGNKRFCKKDFLQKFGPEGFGFIAER
ncbi:hypothetical protein IG197_16795 [Aminobacter sp. SR38]|jgi:hypothetical protein|uniref:hypothetical protein n=1 Tax=Aminobacter sp. SR38 TaxID=2774562 RepID=UPI00178649D8|nr:hypothetical protein [Aminobacter sp. SR38]QOF69521.1 hypothetical protein IG197_16795 [Aminobacter sp. SR38]